ncbi:MAG TPA: hypothetical protein VFV05_15540 [Methylomirabilota bacterium]|nr:hypothetical protein [Methylomirabilota bacterium]
MGAVQDRAPAFPVTPLDRQPGVRVAGTPGPSDAEMQAQGYRRNPYGNNWERDPNSAQAVADRQASARRQADYMASSPGARWAAAQMSALSPDWAQDEHGSWRYRGTGDQAEQARSLAAFQANWQQLGKDNPEAMGVQTDAEGRPLGANGNPLPGARTRAEREAGGTPPSAPGTPQTAPAPVTHYNATTQAWQAAPAVPGAPGTGVALPPPPLTAPVVAQPPAGTPPVAPPVAAMPQAGQPIAAPAAPAPSPMTGQMAEAPASAGATLRQAGQPLQRGRSDAAPTPGQAFTAAAQAYRVGQPPVATTDADMNNLRQQFSRLGPIVTQPGRDAQGNQVAPAPVTTTTVTAPPTTGSQSGGTTGAAAPPTTGAPRLPPPDLLSPGQPRGGLRR